MRIYEELEARAIALELPSLTVDASTQARRLLEGQGFQVLRANVHRRGAVTLENHSMIKVLVSTQQS